MHLRTFFCIKVFILEHHKSRKMQLNEKQSFMLQLLVPALIVTVLFQLVPIIFGFIVSLYDYALYTKTRPFVGLGNYTRLLSEPHFFSVVIPNSFLFTVIAVAAEMWGGIGIALLFNRRFHGENVVRTLLLLPLMIAPVISGVMFGWMFNDQFGIVNVVLRALGCDVGGWFNSRWTAMFVVLLAETWTWTPWFAIFVLATLLVEPLEPKEAARIEGANALQVFRHITFPYLSPVVVVCVLIRTFDAFRQFDHVWAITRGGPARATELFTVYAYKEAFIYLQMGRGAAASVLGALVMLVFGALMYRAFLRLVGRF